MPALQVYLYASSKKYAQSSSDGIIEGLRSITVARGIALYRGFGEVPNVGSRKCKKPKIFMAFEGLRHHLNVL
jgi:hypothetical protein